MGAAAVLTILRDGEPIKTHTLEGEAVVGRADNCVIRLDDRAISRHHAAFRLVGNAVQVERKSEFAPIRVNGAECTRALVKEGDVISIGPYLVKLSMRERKPSAPGPAPVERAPVKAKLSVVPSAPAPFPPLDSQAAASVGNLDDTAGVDSIELEQPEIRKPDEEGLVGADLSVPLEGIAGEGAGVPGLDTPIIDTPMDLGAPAPAVELDSGHTQSDIGATPLPPLPEQPLEPTGSLAIESARTKLNPVAKLVIRLCFQPGAANCEQYDILKDEIVIGRGKDCDVVLNDKKSSRQNAIIRRAGISFILKDLDSANGTFVNGVKIHERELASEDRVRIGATEFQYRVLSADYIEREKDFEPVPSTDEIGPIPDMRLDERINGPFAGMPVAIPDAAVGIGAPDAAMPPPGLPPDMAGGGLAAGIPGITGMPGGAKRNQSLMEKYRALPKRRKAIVTACVIVLAYFLIFDDFSEQPAPKTAKKALKAGVIGPTGASTASTFDSLTPEQQRFVESEHQLAYDYFVNKEYDKALFELNKIFALVPDYKTAREIERYAKEGQQRLQAMEEEKKRKEEEARLKVKVAQLIEETRDRMAHKEYEQARELFSQILALDPDNTAVSDWRKELDAYEEKVREAEQQKQVQTEINKRGWDLFNEGVESKKAGRLHAALESFVQISDIGASEPKLLKAARGMIARCKAIIASRRDPLLAQAKEAEDNGDFEKAFELYRQSTAVDPPYPTGYAGMNRIRGILHDRAKAIYIEAVLAESYSDFTTAKQKFKECLSMAPKDDIYHDRAERKLARYYKTGKDDVVSQ